MLFDSHTHLNNDTFTEADRKRLAEEISQSQVSIIVDVGFDWPSSLQAIKDAKTYPWCYAAIGMHPHDSKLMTEEMLEGFRKLAKEEKVKAIGEIGLDFHYDHSPRDVQRHWFRQQIRLANELKLPIVVHAREADQEVFQILMEEGAFSEERKSWFPPRPVPTEPVEIFMDDEEDGQTGKKASHRTFDFSRCQADARVDIHCFSGSMELAVEYVKAGATIGVDGPLTYKNNRKTVRVVEVLPIDFLLVETDAPYLTPVPFRGKPNKSPYVEFVVRKVAELKGLAYEEVAEKTMENGKRFFNI